MSYCNIHNILEKEPYINIHAHLNGSTFLPNSNCIVLLNLDFSEFEKYQSNQFYSAGFHPWFIENFDDDWTTKLKKINLHQNILAIGECGLDRNIKIDFGLQQQAFQQQILIANQVTKPLIIHSVRAFYDVISELKKAKNKMPVVYHGYNNSLQIAQTLIANNGYLSFGKSILQAKNNTSEILKQLPLEKIFFESDDSIFSIENVFEKASEILNVDVSSLKLQIIKNFKHVFRI